MSTSALLVRLRNGTVSSLKTVGIMIAEAVTSCKRVTAENAAVWFDASVSQLMSFEMVGTSEALLADIAPKSSLSFCM